MKLLFFILFLFFSKTSNSEYKSIDEKIIQCESSIIKNSTGTKSILSNEKFLLTTFKRKVKDVEMSYDKKGKKLYVTFERGTIGASKISIKNYKKGKNNSDYKNYIDLFQNFKMRELEGGKKLNLIVNSDFDSTSLFECKLLGKNGQEITEQQSLQNKLIHAISNQNLSQAKELLKTGAKPIFDDSDIKSPIEIAFKFKDPKIVKAIIKNIPTKGNYCDVDYLRLRKKYKKKAVAILNFSTKGAGDYNPKLTESTGSFTQDYLNILETQSERGAQYVGFTLLVGIASPIYAPMGYYYETKRQKYAEIYSILRSAMEGKKDSRFNDLAKKAKVSPEEIKQGLIVGNTSRAFCLGKPDDVLSIKSIVKWIRKKGF